MARDLSRPISEVSFVVRPDEGGLRLDAFLRARVPWRSRADLQRRIREGGVRVDGRPARKGGAVQPGQLVTVTVDRGPATEEVPVDRIPLEVIYEDDDLVALDKAPGTICHPVGRHVTDTIINALHVRYLGQGVGGTDVRPMIVHRLDQDTSGVLVLAKHPAARQRLGKDFEFRRVAKSYLALVRGVVASSRGTIDLPIGPDPVSEIRLKMACVAGGRPSRTDYEVLDVRGRVSLVRCHPRTGRQHQIRVHLAALGHPILADRLYGDEGAQGLRDDDGRAESAGTWPTRQALHAESLTFRHPRDGSVLHLCAPLAPDLLRAYGGVAPPPPPPPPLPEAEDAPENADEDE